MTHGPVSRREMLRRAGVTGLAAAAVAGGAAWLHGRRPRGTAPDPVALPTYAVAEDDEGSTSLVIARGTSPRALVEAAFEEMGGIGRFVSQGDVVLVKPNAAFDRPSWQGATTDPAVLGAVVERCFDAGAAEVLVTDNPIHVPEGCFRKTGLGKAAEDAGAEVVLPQERHFAPVALPGSILHGWSVLMEPLARATKIIGIAPIKDHNLARASLTMKNWFGLLGGPRNQLHQKLDETIADLLAMVRPTLSVLDGTRILLRNGPTGGSPADVVAGDLVAVSTDGVALDAFGGTLLSLEPDDLVYLGRAEAAGLGTTDWRSLDPREITA